MPPEFDPSTTMLAKLNQWHNAVPFVPFVVVTSSGRAYEVPTPEHLTITRLLREVHVERDDGTGVMISPFHVAAIERLEPAAHAR
jgi:hypothetical protein